MLGKRWRGLAVDLHAGNPLFNGFFQAIAKAEDPCRFVLIVFGGQLHGLGQSHDVGNVFRSGAAAFLLVSADKQRPARRAALDIQRPDALGGVKFMAGE